MLGLTRASIQINELLHTFLCYCHIGAYGSFITMMAIFTAYDAPEFNLVELGTTSSILDVSPGGSEGGGGNENYLPMPIEGIDLPDGL